MTFNGGGVSSTGSASPSKSLFVVPNISVVPSLIAPPDQTGEAMMSSVFWLGTLYANPYSRWLSTVQWDDRGVYSLETFIATPGEIVLGHSYTPTSPTFKVRVVLSQVGSPPTVLSTSFKVTVPAFVLSTAIPVATSPSNQVALHGISSVFSLGSFTAPVDTRWVVVISWGDTQPDYYENPDYLLVNPGSMVLDHVYSAVGTYNVYVQIFPLGAAITTSPYTTSFQIVVS